MDVVAAIYVISNFHSVYRPFLSIDININIIIITIIIFNYYFILDSSS